jgi:acyl-CoA oxidase
MASTTTTASANTQAGSGWIQAESERSSLKQYASGAVPSERAQRMVQLAIKQKEHEEWCSSFRGSVADLPALKDCHYRQSAIRLREMLQAKDLKLTDLRKNPKRFFAAHRILSEHATSIGPGFGIRMTVQYNLFAGTIIALGNDKQVAALEDYEENGTLGCFALTEKLAGVNSGLVVNTTATWNPVAQEYCLHCPDQGAQKNWISQGITAEKSVCIANLIVDGESHGPHAFIMQLRDSTRQLVPGVTIGDMGGKSIGNDLDNAWISFDSVMLPKSALLNRYGDVEKSGDQWGYVQKVEGVKSIDMIGQRLYTGRTVISSSTLVFARSLFAQTRAYSDAKQCWSPKGNVPLSKIPQLSALYAEADQKLGRLFAFMDSVEDELGDHLRCGPLGRAQGPSGGQGGSDLTPMELVNAIAAAKVKCIETTIDLCFRLKQEVGSYALMDGSGFEKLDYLQCCKFAEGDSRILMQKIARDRLSMFKKGPEGTEEEVALCTEIGMAVMTKGYKGWEDSWEQVYALAAAVIERTLKTWEDRPGSASMPCSRL